MLIQRSSCGLKIPPQEALAFRKFYRKEVLVVLTSNRKEVLAACRIQAQATRKKPQGEAGLRTQKEVLARALFLGCTVGLFNSFSRHMASGAKRILLSPGSPSLQSENGSFSISTASRWRTKITILLNANRTWKCVFGYNLRKDLPNHMKSQAGREKSYLIFPDTHI